MLRKLLFVLLLGLAAGSVVSCKAQQAPVESVKMEGFHLEKIEAVKFYSSVEDAESNCQVYLGKVASLREKLVNVDDKGDQKNRLLLMNEILISFERMFGINELMSNVHPDESIRKAAESCQEKAMAARTKLMLDHEVYAAIKAVDVSKADEATKRFVFLVLQEYELSGVDKEESVRSRISELDAELVKQGIAFGRNIRESKPEIWVELGDLAGLPKDFIDSREQKDGKYKLTTDYTDFFPVMNYAEKESVRRNLFEVFNQRAYPANESVLREILKLRAEYASLIGFDNWAAYNSSNKMAKDTETIEKFLDEIGNISRDRMEKDLSLYLDRKKKDAPESEHVYAWDRFYIQNKIKQESYGVDSQAVRLYFPYERVKKGILGIISELYGISFKQVDIPLWHGSVEAYEVYDGDKLIARFFLDMHPRAGKYGHAASFGIHSGVEGLQLPSASLVCNFPQPTDDNPAYMEHKDVVTFFHEFGHLIHQLLAGRHFWVNQSGISCEWDFVEAPSQLFEEWAWSYDVLKHFAVNAAGEVIPEDMVKQMRASDGVGKGIDTMRQLYLAQLSYRYHVADPKSLDLFAEMKRLYKAYMPFPYVEGDAGFASFGHLEGYSSMYYTYMWSLSIAKDMLGVFKSKGLMNKEVAASYRKHILSQGGAKDANEMVKDFLGRDYNLEAFKAWLQE